MVEWVRMDSGKKWRGMADSRGRADTEVGLDRKPGIKLAGLTKKSRQEREKVVNWDLN